MSTRVGKRLVQAVFVLAGVVFVALATFALPVRTWRTGEIAQADFPTSRSPADTPDRLWIDTDPACGNGRQSDPDDCLAILALARSDVIDIVGVSTVFGNAAIEVTDRTARELAARLSASGHRLPDISRGAASPLEGESASAASAALSQALRTKRLTILALGPLTNVATALRSDPSLVANVDRVIAVMGQHSGHLFHPSEGRGNGILFGHGPVFRDLNFRKDPSAVRYLLSTGVPITLIPYEAARDVTLTSRDLDDIAEAGPAGEWVAQGASQWLDFWEEDVGLDGFYPFDLVAARYLLTPEAYSCGPGMARVATGWAPDWLWLLDDAGLFVAPLGSAAGRKVLYCPEVTGKLSVDEMLIGTPYHALKADIGTWAFNVFKAEKATAEIVLSNVG
ncbi:Pyrimidine-specific ribonucleoside hydrolase RihB [Labrenzia sp. THAF35]|uniref:nucleoside hydrolase n=1 Tax=Labrenzia sp. THAF35 TaxID=2587854 RepID=UPI001268422D|nr:nucleoside hydrolase [Labrenzia sp. THAF35]QFT66718.1 Pyrimidine-specific ribonucleoside hydrolase RihB [Labrenzia sp. THAF35]